MKYDVESIKNIPILEVAKLLNIEVKSNKALCIFHEEKTGSLSFDIKNNRWKCFGCGESGDNINLVQKALNYTFQETCEWYNNYFFLGKKLPLKKGNYQKKKIERQTSENYEIDPELYSWIINKCSINEEGIKYLVDDRKFNKSTIEYFNIKSLQNSRKLFIEAKEKWGINRLLKCGVAKKDQYDSTKLVWWDNMLLFPFYDIDNNITYIQGRQLYNKKPKYVNLKSISTNIYNLKVLNNIKEDEYLYICEGITDVLSAYEIKLKAIGILGAHAFKNEWLDKLKKYNIRIVPDVDQAGKDFSEKIEEKFKYIGKNVQVLMLNRSKDLCDFVHS